MAKLHILFMLVSSIALIFAGTGESAIRGTKIARVYLHEYLSGPNQTIYEVARASITAPPTNFGSARVGNDMMTSVPDQTRGFLGRAEALVAFTGQTGMGASVLHIEMNFQAGRYNGSSLTLLGRKRVENFTEEVPIVGGTGKLRAARGYALSYTYSYDPVADYIIYVYELFRTRN